MQCRLWSHMHFFCKEERIATARVPLCVSGALWPCGSSGAMTVCSRIALCVPPAVRTAGFSASVVFCEKLARAIDGRRQAGNISVRTLLSQTYLNVKHCDWKKEKQSRRSTSVSKDHRKSHAGNTLSDRLQHCCLVAVCATLVEKQVSRPPS